ncbi:isoprenylcysteine carboxyl methyltransferase, partial [candidate division KSB1 bacterium]
WRVGVIEADKTELIRTGLYARIRNPYFDGYFLMFLAFIMIRPAVVNLLLAAGAATSFHIMVLREERHLLRVHGQSYLHYKISTGRYAPRGKKR